MNKIQSVLLSVTNKEGLESFASLLKKFNPDIQLIASGGTAETLIKSGLIVTPLSDYTQFPECLDGRVKTIHPKVAGGILFRPDIDEKEGHSLGIKPIQMVVCNLYKFQEAAENQLPTQELLEQMDIGGSTLIRSACKNYRNVAVVVDPKDYTSLIHEIEANQCLSENTHERLALKAMEMCADYDSFIAEELSRRWEHQSIHYPRLIQGNPLRYGENPDQKAWVYQFKDQVGVAQAKVLAGKELSYNNYEDATVAYNAVQSLQQLTDSPAVSIVKHGSICGFATGETISEAFLRAWEGDPKSAFGSIIAINRPIDEEFIPQLEKKFIEVILAPTFDLAFVEWCLRKVPNLRLLELPNGLKTSHMYKYISGGMLLQTTKNIHTESNGALFENCVVTQEKPEKELLNLYKFGITSVNFAKSNVISIVREYKPKCYQLLSIGAGQPNRIDCLQRLALPKAIENLHREHQNEPGYDPKTDLENCVLASDGFFPFDDCVRYAADIGGIKNIVQPGGGRKDKDVTKTADELNIRMVHTGSRYFTH